MSTPPSSGRPAIHGLILGAATGARELDAVELRRVLEGVAGAGFDPRATERAGGRLAGVSWRGQLLKGSDRLAPAEVHYLRHVVVAREWPAGTSLQEYVGGIQAVILDPASAVLTSRYQGAWQLTVVRRSGPLRGPNGFAWVLVDYRVQTGHWVTAYQPGEGLQVLQRPTREGIRWLRRPS